MEQVALHLTVITRNAGHGVPLGLKFRGTVGESPRLLPEKHAKWDNLNASAMPQQARPLPIDFKLAQERSK